MCCIDEVVVRAVAVVIAEAESVFVTVTSKDGENSGVVVVTVAGGGGERGWGGTSFTGCWEQKLTGKSFTWQWLE